MAAPAPAPDAGPPGPHPVPAPNPVPRPAPGPPVPRLDSGFPGKARDMLNNADRITNFKEIPRMTCEEALINTDFTDRLVDIISFLINQIWNQGANGIDVIAAGNANQINQIARLARCFVHFFYLDLYTGIRDSTKMLDPTILAAFFPVDLGVTGQPYPTFFSLIYSMLMPIIANRGLAEVCYIPRFDFDYARAHNNWFNIANIAANDINVRRFGALIDVFKRSKSLACIPLKTGTKFGSGASLLDFWPIGPMTHANSWLYMDNNFNDTDLTVMYILGTDIFHHRYGPFYVHPPTPDENTRNGYTLPYYAGVVENGDTTTPNTDYINDTAAPPVIVNGNVYNRTSWAYVSKVLESIDTFIQDQALNTLSKA